MELRGLKINFGQLDNLKKELEMSMGHPCIRYLAHLPLAI